MFNKTALGQYYIGDTLLHKLDPRIKIILTMIFSIIAIACRNWYAMAGIVIISIFLIILSRVAINNILRALTPFIAMCTFSLIINLFYHRDGDMLLSIGSFHIYSSGIYVGLRIMTRIICIVSTVNIMLLFTTTPTSLTYGISKLCNPLTKFGLNVNAFGMAISLALRFIPVILSELNKIILAHRIRGETFKGGLKRKITAISRVLISVLINCLYRTEDIALAMTCRGYDSTHSRTKLVPLKLVTIDILTMNIGIIILASIATINWYL